MLNIISWWEFFQRARLPLCLLSDCFLWWSFMIWDYLSIVHLSCTDSAVGWILNEKNHYLRCFTDTFLPLPPPYFFYIGLILLLSYNFSVDNLKISEQELGFVKLISDFIHCLWVCFVFVTSMASYCDFYRSMYSDCFYELISGWHQLVLILVWRSI